MASSNCWRCLARPSHRLVLPTSMTSPSASAAFTTSAAQLAKEVANPLSNHVRAGKKLVLNKKKRSSDQGRPILPGERKAWRKRVQLTNNNAFVVPGLAELSAENITDPAAVGQIVGLPDDLVDQLRLVEAFKSTQQWGLFRSPHMLIRQETVDFIKGITEAVSRKETVRTVITGPRGTGKSMIGLQTLSAGFLNNYIVINIPEGMTVLYASPL